MLCRKGTIRKYQPNISGLEFICIVNNAIADRINRELEFSNNMSICRTKILGDNSESSNNVAKILKEIKNTLCLCRYGCKNN